MEYHTDIKKWWHTGRQDGSNKHASKGKKKKSQKIQKFAHINMEENTKAMCEKSYQWRKQR